MTELHLSFPLRANRKGDQKPIEDQQIGVSEELRNLQASGCLLRREQVVSHGPIKSHTGSCTEGDQQKPDRERCNSRAKRGWCLLFMTSDLTGMKMTREGSLRGTSAQPGVGVVEIPWQTLLCRSYLHTLIGNWSLSTEDANYISKGASTNIGQSVQSSSSNYRNRGSG